MKKEGSLYHGYRFLEEIISHCVWLYFRFALSYRDVQEMMVERGIVVSHEAIRHWCEKFGREYVRHLRQQRGRLGDTWHLDEVFVRIGGRQRYLWRAVDQEGNVLDALVQDKRDGGPVLPEGAAPCRLCAAGGGDGSAGELPRTLCATGERCGTYSGEGRQ